MSANGSPGPQVELRIVERTGDVRVAVRTADPQLAGSLREELPQLVSQLGERGYSTETWHPGLAPEAAAGSAVRTGSTSAGSGSDDGTSGNSGRGGSASEGRDGNQGRREQNQNQPEWVDALDRSVGNDRTRARSIL
jgi:hypothetical protein